MRAAAKAAFLKAPADSLDSILEERLGREGVLAALRVTAPWRDESEISTAQSHPPYCPWESQIIALSLAWALILHVLLYSENSAFSCLIVSSGFATAFPIVRGSLYIS